MTVIVEIVMDNTAAEATVLFQDDENHANVLLSLHDDSVSNSLALYGTTDAAAAAAVPAVINTITVLVNSD